MVIRAHESYWLHCPGTSGLQKDSGVPIPVPTARPFRRVRVGTHGEWILCESRTCQCGAWLYPTHRLVWRTTMKVTIRYLKYSYPRDVYSFELDEESIPEDVRERLHAWFRPRRSMFTGDTELDVDTFEVGNVVWGGDFTSEGVNLDKNSVISHITRWLDASEALAEKDKERRRRIFKTNYDL